MRVSLLIMGVIFCCCTVPALAQRPHRIDLSAVAGAAVFTRELPASFILRGASGAPVELRNVGINDDIVLGGHLGFWLTPRLAVEASAMIVPTMLHGTSGIDIDVSTYAVGLRWLTPHYTRVWQPYVVTGPGAVRYDFTGDVRTAFANFAWSVGAGFVTDLAFDVRLRVEARDFISRFQAESNTRTSLQHDVLLTAGFDLDLARSSAAARRQ